MSAPLRISSIASSHPRASASLACCAVIAGSRAALAVPIRIFAAIRLRMVRQFGGHPGVDHANGDAAGRGKRVGAGPSCQIRHHHRHRDRRMDTAIRLRPLARGRRRIPAERRCRCAARPDAGSCRVARRDPTTPQRSRRLGFAVDRVRMMSVSADRAAQWPEVSIKARFRRA